MSCLQETLRETFFGCINMIKKETNKSTNKQTKQINILDPKYLSQIKSDLHKTFREASCWYPIMINTKNKQLHKQTNKQTNKQF